MDFRKPASRILFIGHRGFPALAPENTLPSFERALDAGCDAIECDVRITKDGHFVVMHDETPARTTDAAERFPGKTPRVSDLTFSEIRQLDAGSWFAGQDPSGASRIPVFHGRKPKRTAELPCQNSAKFLSSSGNGDAISSWS